MSDRMSIPVSLPKGLVDEMNELIGQGKFSSKSDAIRFGVRLLIMLEKRTHMRAEDYAYSEIKERLKRGRKNVSRH